MFICNKDRIGTCYFEFQFCKIDRPIKRSLFRNYKITGYDFWLEDSIYIKNEDLNVFMAKCSDIAKLINRYNNFNYTGVSYYDKKTTQELLVELKKHKDKNIEKLIIFLESAIENYNGFYILEI